MSSNTSSPGVRPASNSDNNGDSVNFTALVVALVALVVALLQLILQYVLSAESRSKCSKAAIGRWSTKNKQYWRPWRAKLYIRYARPSISRKQFLAAVREQGTERHNNLEILDRFKVMEHLPIAENKDGVEVTGVPQVILTRRGTEEATHVNINTLRGRERDAAMSLSKVSRRLFTPPPPTKATWCSLLCDLGLDLERLPGTGEMIDADTIPSVLDAPPLQIRMSDLIHFGLLLEMTLVNVDEYKRVINMTGRHCSLVSKYQDGIGMLSRYTPMAYNNQPAVRRASDQEAQILCETADGMIYIGDCMMIITSWGYNSLDSIFKHVLRECQNNIWQEMPLKEFLRAAEGDSLLSFGGKWANPPTPNIALLMAMCGNVGVATAFPHDTIKGWEESMVSRATREAFSVLTDLPGFAIAPRDIFHRISEAPDDIMVMDEYKTVNNYGCQFGGIRGWLSTNLSEFTLRMSRIWNQDHDPNLAIHPVPLLTQLFAVLQAGALSKEWGERYNHKQEEGNGWKLPVNSLLWMQISLLDTWLARHVDIMVGGTAMPELSVPANISAAEQCARAARQVLKQSTGWNPPRLRFCRMYLAKLANGVDGKGPSFMSTGDVFADRKMGWAGMPTGTPEGWMIADAVLTLRAACQHTRFMLMKNSSPLLRMKNFDPVLLLA